MFAVFVSYRADDARYGAAGCYELLSTRFGSSRVFRDCVSLDPGQRYPGAIRQALEEMQVLVALIGPGWLADDPDATGRRLVDREHDWVRSEIRRALARGVPIIPVLLDGTDMPTREQLPADIAELALRQAAYVHHRTFGPDIERLADRITDLVPELTLPDLFVPAPRLPDHALPSMLLRAEYRVVPFADRDQEMARLTAWLEGTDQVGVRLLTGPGGQGKTRLADQLVEQARDRGWAAGFVAERVPDPVLARVAGVRAPLLLVVDYAEGRTEQLCQIATTLATRPPDHGLARVLMLARSAGIWQRQLRPPDDEVALVFADLRAVPLAPLTAPDDRRAEFERALVAFAAQLRRPVPDLPAPADLRTGGYDRVLEVHAAALAALLDTVSATEPTPARRDPVLRVLDHERRHWNSTAASYDLPDPHPLRLDQVVTAATLFGADDVAAARAVLTTLPTFDDDTLDVVDRYRRWLAAVYPGAAALNPLRPDRLGEDLVATTLDEQPEVTTATAPAVDEDQLTQALTVLGRAAPRHPDVQHAMTTLLATDAPDRIPVGMWVATQLPDGTALVDVLDRLDEGTDDVKVRQAVLDNLPDRSVALAAFAVVRTRAALEHARNQADPDLLEVAWIRHDLSLRLSEIGEHDQALVAISQVVEYLRSEVTAGNRKLEPDLAMALNTLATALHQLGFGADALEAASESIAGLRHHLPASPELRTYLATSLMNYGNLLVDLARPTEAMAAIEEAVALQLAEVRDVDEDDFVDRLARYAAGLDNLSTAYTSVGETPKALDTLSQAVQLYRELDTVSSDMYRVDLIRGLVNLGGAHFQFGQPEQGRLATEEAVLLARELVERHGDVHLRQLAEALNNDAVLLGALDRHHQAHDRITEAVGIYRRLATTLPGSTLAELAEALHNLAKSAFRRQNFAEALDAYDEAADIYRKLAGPRPETAEPELADILFARADLLHDHGEYAQAEDDASEVVEVLERLVEQDRTELRHKLAAARHLLGVILTAQDKTREAAQVATRAADEYAALVASGCSELNPEWASALHAQAIALDDAGFPAEAVAPFARAVELLRPVDDDELSSALHGFAQCLSALDRHEDALELVTEAVARRREALDEQYETRWSLAESLNNRADTLSDLGRYQEALVDADDAVVLFAGLLRDGHHEAAAEHACALEVQARAREGHSLTQRSRR